jgi:hypothetical protein
MRAGKALRLAQRLLIAPLTRPRKPRSHRLFLFETVAGQFIKEWAS